MDFKRTSIIHHTLAKNHLQLTLRSAEPHDAERLLKYLDQVAGESENLGYGHGELGLSIEEERVVLQRMAQSPTSLYLLAEVADEIVGVLTFTGGKRLRVQHQGEVGISVLRMYWNLKIGSHLLTYLIEWARQTGTIRKINLRVRVDNLAAIHVYEKHGFVREGHVSRDFFLHGQFIDAYLMGKQLDPV